MAAKKALEKQLEVVTEFICECNDADTANRLRNLENERIKGKMGEISKESLRMKAAMRRESSRDSDGNRRTRKKERKVEEKDTHFRGGLHCVSFIASAAVRVIEFLCAE